MKRAMSGIERMVSALSVTKLHTSMPSSPSQSMSVQGMAAGRLNSSDPFENGCAAKPKPPCAATAAQMAAPRQATIHLALHAEGEEVVAALGRDLLAHQHEHRVVPALLAMAAGGERVVVGEQHHVHGVASRRRRDLGTVPVPSE